MIKYNAVARSIELESRSINKLVTQHLQSSYSGELLKLLEYTCRSGKNLRGILLKTASKQFSGDSLVASKLAISIELGHSASLVHDDIMDHSKSRRGAKSFWHRYGMEKAVIIPHILISDALSIAMQCGSKYAQASINSWGRASTGQYMDLIATKGSAYDYNKLIDLKSASLFECACQLGAMTASNSSKFINEAKETGRQIGIIYQMIDDYVGRAKREKGGSTSLFNSYIKQKRGAYDYLIKEITKSLSQINHNKLFRLKDEMEWYVRYSIVKKFEEGDKRVAQIAKKQFQFI